MAVIGGLVIEKPVTPAKWVWRRDMRKIDQDAFWKDVSDIFLLPANVTMDPNSADVVIDSFEKCVRDVLDHHAPLRKRKERSSRSHFTLSLSTHKAKKIMRVQELQWRSSKTTVHREVYKKSCNNYFHLIKRDKQLYMRQSLGDCPNVKSTYVDETGPNYWIIPQVWAGQTECCVSSLTN
jgi:hypothetical protein